MLLFESGKLRKWRGGFRVTECGAELLIWLGRACTDCPYEATLPITKTLNRRLIVLALREGPFRQVYTDSAVINSWLNILAACLSSFARTNKWSSLVNSSVWWHTPDINNQSWDSTPQSTQLSTGADQYRDESTGPPGTPHCLVGSVETFLGPTLIPLSSTALVWSFAGKPTPYWMEAHQTDGKWECDAWSMAM